MKKFFRDTYVIAKHDVVATVKDPFWLSFGLFQPIVYLLLFFPFLKGVAGTPGFPGGTAIQFFAPGLLIMSAIFNSTMVGFGLVYRLQNGFLERIRVTPVSRFGLVFGLVSSDAVTVIIQSTVLTIATLFFGAQPNIAGTMLVFGLLLLITIMLASASYAVALTIGEIPGFSAVSSFFTVPLVPLSGIMLPLAFAPRVIQFLAACTPFSYAVTAARSLMMGTFADPAIWQAFGICAVLGALALSWFAYKIREAVA